MRKLVWISSGIALVAVVAAAVSLPLVVRSRLRSRLAERGLVGEVRDISLSPSGVRVRNLEVLLPDKVGTVRLEETRASLDWWGLAVREVHVEGGTVELHGSPGDVERALSKVARSKDAPSGSSSSERYVSVRKLQLEWTKLTEGSLRLSASNVQLDHGPGGSKLGVDVIRVSEKDQSLTVVGTLLETSGKGGTRRIEQASLGEIFFRSGAKPVTGGSADNRGENSPSGTEPVKAEPSLFFGLEEGRASRWAEKLRALREKVLPHLPSRVEAKKVSAEVVVFEETLHVGPASLNIARADGRVTATLSPHEEGNPQKLALSLSVTEGEGETELGLVGGPVSLKQLGIHEGDFGLSSVGRALLHGDVRLKLSPDLESLHASGSANLLDLGLKSPKLASSEVLFPRIATTFELDARVNGSLLAFQESSLEIGEAKLKGDLTLKRSNNSFTLNSNVKSSLVSCQALLNSLPNALLSNVKELELRGTVSFASHMSFDSEHLGRAKVSLDVGGDCEVKSLPKSLDPEMFRKTFTREVEGPADVPTTLSLGPGTENWTDKAALSPFLEKAVLVTEDGRFFRHRGFDPRAIESSIIDNVKAGRFVRGASTISMQLAKNLYLSREKVLSRKLQELFLTMVLEQSFEKSQLLELYFNVVELGPYVYGVKQAADYYFKTTPAELTAMQAFFLASVLPNPTKSHFDKKGRLYASHAALLKKLIGIALERKLITPEEAERANAEELVFGQKETTPASPSFDVASPSERSGGSP